jgi:choline dehydrogenase-like flavoprotein
MPPARDVADILIVGSGASGGVFAWHLSELPGLKIVCLEQGNWVQPSPAVLESNHQAASPHPEAEAQRQRLTTPPESRPKTRHWRDGYPYDYSESYWTPLLMNAVGGASLHYGAVWARLHPSDFVTRSLEGVGQDWPIRYWDLEPFYDLVDNAVGVAGVPGNPAYPPMKARRMPSHPLGQSAEIMVRGFKKLGWHWWPTTMAVITEPLGNRRPCPTNCDACDEGCPREAKNSSDVVFWPEAIKNGVELRPKSRVREITVNKRGLADGALYYDADGRLYEQKARLVVLACNGIGTPRLLLNSKSSRFPHGLANSTGLVGRNLMAHPMYNVSAVFEHESVAPRQYRSNGLISDQFYEGDPGRRGFARGFWWLSGGYSGPVRAALGEAPSPRATLVPAALQVNRFNALPWGAAHHAAFDEQYTHTAGMSFLCEELATDNNRVELDPTLTDDLGIPAPKLFFQQTDNLKKMIAFGIERTKEMLMAAGATKIVSTAPLREGGAYHLMGTARMGDDPEQSVVDKWGRAHDVKNLFIIDGSIMVTSGAVVVTNTIQALALRIAEYVKKNAHDLVTT